MALYEELQALIGKEGPLDTGPDEVCKPMIRHWCEAVEDSNPVYRDEEYARKSKYGGIIAPPAMIQAWTMPPLWPNGQENNYRHPERIPQDRPKTVRDEVMARVQQYGYGNVVATENAFEFIRPTRPGDRVSRRLKLVSVSPEKTTRTGIGHFVNYLYTYTNQKGETLCRQTFTMFLFKDLQPGK